jgi:hypothetical protein
MGLWSYLFIAGLVYVIYKLYTNSQKKQQKQNSNPVTQAEKKTETTVKSTEKSFEPEIDEIDEINEINNIEFLFGNEFSFDIHDYPEPTLTKNGWLLNPGTNFLLTLSSTDSQLKDKLFTILKSQKSYFEIVEEILELHSIHNFTILEIEDFVREQSKLVAELIEKYKSESLEWNTLGEKDKVDLYKEYKLKAVNNLQVSVDIYGFEDVYDFTPQNLSIDDEIISEYGFKNIYFYIENYSDNKKVKRIVSDNFYRKHYEELHASKLALRGKEIPTKKIVEMLTVKELNAYIGGVKEIRKKSDAVDAFMKLPNHEEILNDNVAFRELFLLVDLPERYTNLDLNLLKEQWNYYKIISYLLISTYRTSIRNNSRFQSISKYNSKVICSSGNEKCKKSLELDQKSYDLNNAPKLPLHPGCNCRYSS